KRPDLGVRISAENGQAKLANVFDDGAAQQAGLSAGDVLVAIDGLKVTAGNLEKVLQHIGVGQTVPVHLFRRDELLCFDVVMQPPPCDTCELILLEDVSEEIARRRAAWLGG
ncbi:MAG TPA: PDZ domain-containing protein, partial [Candidatus Tenderia sp.]|nr:PDZ domain-containing protein [Candidatus Tenderia sp.]